MGQGGVMAFSGAAIAAIAALNLWAGLMMVIDKRAARRGRRRIPEARLLRLAALGGGAGALLAGHLARHKTRKQPFGRRLVGCTLLGLALCAVIIGATIVLAAAPQA
ncbi:NAD transhydrogenase subunit beta [Profundibacterium mesophilum KAUST100406-0324]|uniref:NAD transhydrogenase subunit beta n=2 Tax=Profundibacterium TaxID=1258570 RepID=A0A921NXI8_9RHOB|nr:NAD transhydrogenase subunit beta [Profundibacterium mesophilum KAUST100406-0324]